MTRPPAGAVVVAGGTGADAADRDAAIVGVPGSTLVAAALGEVDAGPVACADALGVGEGSTPDLVGALGPGVDVDAAHAASQTSASSSATPIARSPTRTCSDPARMRAPLPRPDRAEACAAGFDTP